MNLTKVEVAEFQSIGKSDIANIEITVLQVVVFANLASHQYNPSCVLADLFDAQSAVKRSFCLVKKTGSRRVC